MSVLTRRSGDAACHRGARTARHLAARGNAPDHRVLRVHRRHRVHRHARVEPADVGRSGLDDRPPFRRGDRTPGTLWLFHLYRPGRDPRCARRGDCRPGRPPRLGWIAEFLSAPIITGFLAGVAVIIVVHQLPDLFGLPSTSGSTLHRIGFALNHLGQTSGWALGIGAATFAVVLAGKRIDRRLPGVLAALVGSTVVVGVLGLPAHGVSVLGAFAHGVPRFGLVGLSWSALGSVAPIAGVVALVVLAQSAATSRAFADEGDYEVDVGRDFIGVGAGNIAAGLCGSFPVNGSAPRTAAVASVRGRTQAAGLGAAAALALLIPAAALLKDVPLAALAGVLLYIATRIFHVHDLVEIARFDRFELALALVTLLTVALVGVEQGIGVALGLAVVDRTRLSARPQLHVLGRIPGTTSWAPLSANEGAVQLPGVLVVLFATPLWYANACIFVRR